MHAYMHGRHVYMRKWGRFGAGAAAMAAVRAYKAAGGQYGAKSATAKEAIAAVVGTEVTAQLPRLPNTLAKTCQHHSQPDIRLVCPADCTRFAGGSTRPSRDAEAW